MTEHHVIVIEAQILVRRGIEALVAEALPGAKVSGLDSFPASRPDADLIICDFLVGKTKASGFLKALRKGGCATPVLVFTTSGNEKIVEKSLRAGASAFLPKHAGLEDFRGAMRALLAGDACARHVHPGAPDFSKHRATVPNHGLSRREQEVFAILGQEVPVRIIARRLGISVKTVETHRESIKNKLGLHKAAEVVLAASRWLSSRQPKSSGILTIGESA